ncbi:MAG: hypothetical protein II249_03415 [Bacteroidaceae bacterium]|nr:hypothetical protein [Bacteroidaceae bacterium]
MDERIKKIADYYGYESQMDMLCEECGEFVQARNKLRRNVDGAYQNCLEEIADIAIMVEQMKLICGADRIEQIMNEKLDRQIQRIKDESEPETAELPEVNTEGMQSGEIRTARNGDAWKLVKKI